MKSTYHDLYVDKMVIMIFKIYTYFHKQSTSQVQALAKHNIPFDQLNSDIYLGLQIEIANYPTNRLNIG